jgi:hypothetical protein
MIMHRPIFMVKPNLFAPGTVNPRHKLLNGARGGGDSGYGSSLVRSPPVLQDYHAKHAADLLAEFLTCSRKSAHVRLDPKVTSTRVENNPLSRAQNGSGGSASTRGSSRANGAERVEMVWRWCGDSLAAPSR